MTGDTSKLIIRDLDQLSQVNVEEFPIALDFQISLSDQGRNSTLSFATRSLDLTINFPWWDNPKSEIADWSLSDIPNGTMESPYLDMDQGWQIVIWQHGNSVYIAQGGDNEQEFDVWFSVPRELYFDQWSKAIRQASNR